MNDLRPWLRLSLLALLLVAFVPGCANNIRRKAEMARAEAAYLESTAVEQWVKESGKSYTETPTYDDIRPYLPERNSVRQRGGNDPFGNPYVLNSVRQGVTVNAKTIELCAEVTKREPSFWGHHDKNVLDLIEAAGKGDIEAVRTLVNTVSDPNIPNYSGDKALVFAMGNGNDEMEKVLTAHGAVLDAGDITPLLLAIGDDNVEVAKALLDRFPYMATVTKPTPGSSGIPVTYQPALTSASRHGNWELVRILLEYGADPNTNEGFPLWSAVVKGHMDTVRLLVEADAWITPEALRRARRGDRPEICEYLESRINAAMTKGEQPESTQK